MWTRYTPVLRSPFGRKLVPRRPFRRRANGLERALDPRADLGLRQAQLLRGEGEFFPNRQANQIGFRALEQMRHAIRPFRRRPRGGIDAEHPPLAADLGLPLLRAEPREREQQRGLAAT